MKNTKVMISTAAQILILSMFCSMYCSKNPADNTTDQTSGNNNPGTAGLLVETSGDTFMVWIETEHIYEIPKPFEIINHTNASGGQFIQVPASTSVISFTVQKSAVYKFCGRVLCTYGGNDSFSIGIDKNFKNWNGIKHNTSWIWDNLDAESGGVKSLRTVFLTAGTHTFDMRPREAGAKLDQIIVTSNQNYNPSGAITEDKLPDDTFEYILVEAESGAIYPAFYIREDANASGGSYVTIPADTVDISFEAPGSGTSHVWARMYQTGGNGDSFRVRFGNTTFTKWDAFGSANQFVWEKMPFSPVSVDSGNTYTISVKYREEGAGIDRIVITNDPGFVPTETGN